MAAIAALGPKADVNAVATWLGIGVRTLHQACARVGEPFSGLREHVRKAGAKGALDRSTFATFACGPFLRADKRRGTNGRVAKRLPTRKISAERRRGR